MELSPKNEISEKLETKADPLEASFDAVVMAEDVASHSNAIDTL
jgi:hypothetical protein